MKQFIFTLTFVLIYSLGLEAQLLTPYTLYRDQWSIINPAAVSNNYTINEYSFSASASDRHQWLVGNGFGSDITPVTQTLNFEAVIYSSNIVVGGHIMRDKVGAFSSIGAFGHFAYMMNLDRFEDHVLTVGVSAGLIQYRSAIDGNDPEYFLIPEADIAPENVAKPDVNVGIYYHYRDMFYAGLSVPQLLSNTTQFGSEEINFSLRRPRHYYGVVGGYVPFDFFGFADESSFWEFSAWGRYIPIKVDKDTETDHKVRIDANARYQYNNLFWGGLGMGFGNQNQAKIGHAEVGFILGEGLGLTDAQFKIGLAYDFPIDSRLTQFGSSVELNLVFSWF